MTKTDQEVIRACVGYADGWLSCGSNTIRGPKRSLMRHNINFTDIGGIPKEALDALAAQLVRQIDALGDWSVNENKEFTTVDSRINQGDREWHPHIAIEGPDRTMNTLRACEQFYQEKGDE